MKILIVEPMLYETEFSQDTLKHAFNSLNHNVYRFDYRTNYSTVLNKIPIIGSQYLIANFRKFVPKLDIKFIDYVRQIKPDFILVNKGESISARTITYIKKKFDIPIALWFVDDPQFHNIMAKHYYQAYDYYFSSSYIIVRELKRKGYKRIEYLAFCCEPKFQKQIKVKSEDALKYKSDLNFVGTFYPERWKYIRHLKDYDLKIWGKWWKLPLLLSKMSSFYQSYFINSKEWVKLFNVSKITLNIHLPQMKWGGMKSNHRTFEATGCGAFVLCDKTDGIEDLFIPDKEIVLFNNVNDLKEKIDYYLTNEKERNKIAENGNKRCYKDHTYKHRALQILKALKLK